MGKLLPPPLFLLCKDSLCTFCPSGDFRLVGQTRFYKKESGNHLDRNTFFVFQWELENSLVNRAVLKHLIEKSGITTCEF